MDFGRGAPTLKNGRYVRAWFFKNVLSHSRHSYEEVVWGQDVETFIRCHERAFASFGGVPRVVRIDNLKSGVLEANLFEPVLNPAYAAFAKHAGFAPLPCLPRKPVWANDFNQLTTDTYNENFGDHCNFGDINEVSNRRSCQFLRRMLSSGEPRVKDSAC